MAVFRVFLVAIFAGVAIYTSVTIGRHGLGFLPVFFGDMLAMGWPGQFNFDFMCLLTLSALWVAWRHHFSGAGLALAVLALFGGALFLSAYLFIESLRVGGDAQALLIGRDRAARGPTARA